MTISAFSYVRNGLRYQYPFLQSLQSVLPIVDEFIMVVGDSADGTREAIERLGSPKIKIIDTIWDMSLREGGKLFAQQADIGLKAATGDWLIHIQADEVFHEKDVPHFRELILKYADDSGVEGLLFPFLNFRGDYQHIHTGRKSHRFEVRAFRRNPKILSYRDSQGFRKFDSGAERANGARGEKLRVIKTSIPVYHYSYVRPPVKMKEKVQVFSSFYMDDQKLEKHFKDVVEMDYNDVDRLEVFTGSHPHIMDEVIRQKDWDFKNDPTRHHTSFRHRILNRIEAWTGYRIGEFKNYKIIGREP